MDPIPYDTPKPAGHTRFVCVSDTHSRTDGIQMPYGDVLLHMGDFTELGLPSEVKKFNDWLGTELLNPHAQYSCSRSMHCFSPSHTNTYKCKVSKEQEAGPEACLTVNQTTQ